MQSVTVTSTDPSADLFADGNPIGRGTATVSLSRNKDHSLMARLGERVSTFQIGTHVSTTGALDILGTVLFLIPVIGVAGAGFWSLDTDSVILTLPPAAPAAIAQPAAVPEAAVPPSGNK